MVPFASYAPSQLHHDVPGSIEAVWGLRKLVVTKTETYADGGSTLSQPITQVTASAVFRNPWIDDGVDSELIVSPQHIAARLAKLLSDRVLASTGGVEPVKAFGKGAIIGERGELEHGAAITHTPYFAGNLRTLLEGTAVISFADTRGPAGETLVVPLCEKLTGVVRDYYQAVPVRIPDAPLPDELVLVAAASTGPRPFPRVGDRATDLPIDISEMNGVFK